MHIIGKVLEYDLVVLTKNLAIEYATEINELFNLIPKVESTEDKVTAESKVGRIFHNKWDHSLLVFDKSKVIAVLIAYERESEDNEQYPEDTIYISELCVAENYQGQGVGHKLMEIFLGYNNDLGFITLKGATPLNYSVQTNSAEFNDKVQKFYESFGFKKRAEKEYDNRVDNVYELKP